MTIFGTPSATARRAAALAPATLALFLAAGLSGCLTEKSEDGGGGTLTTRSTSGILVTTNPTESKPGMIVTHEVEYDCWDGELETYEYEDTTYYALAGGKLLIWEAGDCLAAKLNGSSSTVTGTWTTNNILPTDSVPAAYRDPDCDDEDEFGEELVPIFENLSASITITDTALHATTRGTVCYGKFLAALIGFNEFYEVVSSSCDEVRIRNNVTDKTAKYTMRITDNKLVSKFSYAGKSCTQTISMDDPDEPPVCSETDESDDAYDACIAETGFYGTFGDELGKKAAGDGISKELRKAVRRASSPWP